MSEKRERGIGRQRKPQAPTPQPLDRASTNQPIDQMATARYTSYQDQTTQVRPGQPFDEPMTIPTSAPRASASGAGRRTMGPQSSQSLVPMKPNAERERALAVANTAAGTTTTLIPGAKKYRAPAVRLIPRRNGPRSAIAQFAVSMIVTAILISVLTLSTPLGQASAMSADGPMQSYTSAIPWIPTPTPKPTPRPTPPPYRPPAGANPGQQAVINDIVAVFGSYSQGALNIARCESSYDPNAWNSYPILNSHASGVFQILYPSTWNTTSYSGSSPFNADANIHAAYEIFRRDGYSWREWQCQP